MKAAEPNDVITLHPGDVALGMRGDRLETLLGSCVAILLTDPRRTIGVMCHIVHSQPSVRAHIESNAYANVALASMVNLLQSRGITASLCDAYVFGGGNMFPQIVFGRNVGDGNAQWALNALASMGVRVLSADIGGTACRKLSWTVGPDAPVIVAIRQ